jgi:pimeloyl-ACP methyl ester carboxylesterase
MQLFWACLIFLSFLLDLADTRFSDEYLLRKLNTDSSRTTIAYYNYKDYRIRYADIGNENKPMVIFVHGAPGGLDAFIGFLNDSILRRQFRMISVDRPGYGFSGFGKPMVSIEEQAKSLLPLLDLNKNPQKPLLVGHSYGGPIIAKMAMLARENVGGILLVGAAVDPDHEKFFMVNSLASRKFLRRFVPVSMYVANEEKLAHVKELKKMENEWDIITAPVTIIHGGKDELVPVENGYFAENKLQSSHVTMRIYNATGHLIPWLEPDYMKKEIIIFPFLTKR